MQGKNQEAEIVNLGNERHQWLYLGVFPVGHGAVDWGSGSLWVLVPAIAMAMDLSPSQVGLLFAMAQLSGGLTQLPAGIAGDVLRNRGMFLLATFWWVALGQVAASLSPTYWLLILCLMFSFAGASAWHPVAMGTMVQQMPGKRTFVLAIHSLGGTMAEIIAPTLVGFLLTFLDWRRVFQINTIPAVVMGIVFLKIGRKVAPAQQDRLTMSQLFDLIRIISSPRVLVLVVVFMLHNMTLLAFMSMAPFYLQVVRGFSSSMTGLAISLLVVSGALAAPVIARISDNNSRKPFAVSGLFGGGLCVCLIPLVPTSNGILFLLSVIGVLMLSARPVVISMALERIGRRESTVLGLIACVGEGMAAFGAAVAGMLGNLDLAYSLIFAGSLSVLAGSTVAFGLRSGSE